MPPYTPVTSKAESRFLFAHPEKVSNADARGKTKAANFKSLPEYAHRQKSKHPGVRALGRVK